MNAGSHSEKIKTNKIKRTCNPRQGKLQLKLASRLEANISFDPKLGMLSTAMC